MKKQTDIFPQNLQEPVLLRMFNIMRRRFKIVLLIFSLSLLLSWSFISLQTPVYQAVATIDLSKALERGQSLTDIVETLESRSLAKEMVQQMNLDWQVVKLTPGLDVKINRFSISRDIPGLRIVLEKPPLYRVSDLSGRFIENGRSGEPFRAGEIDFILDIRKGQIGQELTIEHRPNDVYIDEITDNVKIVPWNTDGNLVKIFSSGPDPEKTRDVANALIETYRAQILSQSTKSLTDIEQQITESRESLAEVSKELQEYDLASGFHKLPSDRDALTGTLNQFHRDREQLDNNRQRLDHTRGQLQKAISTGSAFLPPPMDEFPHITEMSAGLAKLSERYKELLIEFTRAHPDVIEIQDAIMDAQKALLARYSTVIDDLDSEIAVLNTQIAIGKDQLDLPPDDELFRLDQSRKTIMEILATLQQRQRNLQLEQTLAVEQIRVADPAVTPRSPIKPDKEKILAVGGTTGLLLGFLCAILLSVFDRRFNTIEEVRAKLKLPIFGVIPKIPDVDHPGVPVAVQMPKAPVVEAFRALRTRLHSVTKREKHKIILVTSSLPGEGKSTISTNLAVVLAQTRAKVLLIGCDLRRPSLHEMFGQTNVPGLVDLLSEERQDAVRHIANPRIDFLPAGTIPLNPSEILDSVRMRNFLDTVRSRYDYVVIDAPPVLPVTDAQILSPLADITLAVLEPCRVPEKAAMQMVESLHSVGATISGMVINDRVGRGFKYYGSFSYYGNKNYSGYYGENPDDLVDGFMVRAARKIWGKLND